MMMTAIASTYFWIEQTHRTITQIDIEIDGGILLGWVGDGVGLVAAEVAHEGRGLEKVTGLVGGWLVAKG